jgi:O-antigen/teichoic acid export membrane protein
LSLGDTIRGGVRWVVAGKIGHEFLHFALSIVLARLLTPTDFGLLVTVQIFTGIAGFVAGGGMGQALVQAKTVQPRDTHVVFTAQLCICIVIYLMFFMISPAFAAWFDEPQYENLLRVSALTFLIRPFANVPNSLLHHAMRYKAKAFINIVILTVTGTTSVSLALLGYGVWSLVLGGLAGALANVTLAMIISRWTPRLVIDMPILKRFANYGIKVSLNDIVVYLRKQSSNFVVSRFIGTEAVGLYNKAASLNQKPRGMLSGSAYHVVFRAMSKTQENLDQSKYIYLRTITLVSVYALPFYVGLWWVAEPFIVTVYGAHWAASAPLLKILVFTALLDIINNQSGAVSAARRMLGRELAIQITSWVLLIAAIAVGYRWGIEGVAWAVVVASAPYALLMARMACTELHVSARDVWNALVPALLLNGLLASTLWVADWLLTPALPATSAAYLAGMVTVGAGCYVLYFLFLPIASLRKEAERWKNRLHIPH